MTKEKIQQFAESLANVCLLNGDEHRAYSDRDLFNATLILIHFWNDVMFSENQHLSKENILKLVCASGDAFRELIKVSTGKDMGEIAKNLKK